MLLSPSVRFFMDLASCLCVTDRDVLPHGSFLEEKSSLRGVSREACFLSKAIIDILEQGVIE
jgi:hypothetical protein